ncbi:MAG: metal-sulfur cluster assembly factor [Nanoarchaeota archaeon]
MKPKEKIIEALKKVKDPEIGLDIWTLGLVYNIHAKEKNAQIKMTFTSPLCPFGPMLILDVKREVQKIGYKDVNVEIVFNPPWKPSKEVRAMLGV